MSLDAIHKAIGEGLIRRAEIDGRDFDSFLAEWLRHCEALKESPMNNPTLLLELADIDRYCGNKHSPQELEVERQAYIRHRTKKKGLQTV